jgi:Holliday junction resolvasome RuvABC DNA-binding subunit
VRIALDGLGYQADEIGAALRDLPADLPTEQLLKKALQRLGRGGER